jgi:hypothetical protein
VKASSTEWVRLEGQFHLESGYQRTVFYLEGPPSGVDLLVGSVTMKPVNSPSSEGQADRKQASNYALFPFVHTIQRLCRYHCWITCILLLVYLICSSRDLVVIVH